MAVVPAHCGRYEAVHSRREFLAKSAFGFGMLSLPDQVAELSGQERREVEQGVGAPAAMSYSGSMQPIGKLLRPLAGALALGLLLRPAR